jgi:hypothetical protein
MHRRDFLKVAAGAAALPFIPNPPAQAGTKVVLASDAHIFTTGLPTLDHALGGGLRAGCVGLIFAKQKHGKTALMRTMFKANCPGIDESPGIRMHRKGVNDVLHMWPARPDLGLPETGGCLVTDISPFPVDEEAIRCTRGLCQSADMTAIMTVNIEERQHNKYDLLIDGYDGYEMLQHCLGSFSIMRMADYVLTLHAGNIYVVKSRYEPKGAKKIIPAVIRYGRVVEI